MPEPSHAPVLSLSNLVVEFKDRRGTTPVLHAVSFDLARGRTLALVGESGCGKTLSALALLGLIESPGRVTAGSVRFHGEELLGAPPSRWAEVRGNRVAMIFQEPLAALNPVLSIGEQLMEPLRVHRGLSVREARARVLALLDEVGVPAPRDRLSAYPHELSGGLAQRVMIAMALTCEPEVIIADEPTTALDVTIQAQILTLLQRLQRERQMAMLFITHDMAIVANLADELLVMYSGRVVEQGAAADILAQPQHPYTHALWGTSLAALAPGERLLPIAGPPAPISEPRGCTFAPRCPRRLPRCNDERPALADGVACFAPHERRAPFGARS
jgi:peptide/nickel transport system ATP-binding protein